MAHGPAEPPLRIVDPKRRAITGRPSLDGGVALETADNDVRDLLRALLTEAKRTNWLLAAGFNIPIPEDIP
jgi:hypothetical protein